MANTQGVIQNIGDYQLIFGNAANSTLTGNDNANIFLHQGSSNNTIKNFNPSTDVILLEKGKVTKSSKSSNGKDVILKISDGNTSLGKITIKNVADNDINIYDDEKITEAKEIFSELTTAYASSASKTFDEDDDIQSILNDGSNISVNGGSGNDFINNSTSYVTIYGGAGKDYIYNNSSASLTAIDGGASNDSIKNDADDVTINGGDENDTINNRGEVINRVSFPLSASRSGYVH